jgi:group I intron endonuclease
MQCNHWGSTVKNNLTISRALVKYGYSNFTLEIVEYCDVSVLLEREQHYIDLLKPTYNIAKIAGSTLGVPKSAETKAKISQALKGVYTGEKSPLFGKTLTEETKLLMSQARQGTDNSMYGKTHTEQSKSLMSLAKTGKVRDNETRKAISAANGTAVFLYAACSEHSSDALCLIQKFTSLREAGKYLGISHSNVSRYVKSGALFSRRGISYKFSLTLLDK